MKNSNNDFFNSLNKNLKMVTEKSHFDEFTYLVGLDKNLQVDYSYCLRTASAKGFFPIIQHIVEHIDQSLIHSTDALFWAAIKGDVSILKYFIEQGADIHKNDNYIFKRTVSSSKDMYGFHSNLNVLEFLYTSFKDELMETIFHESTSPDSLLFKWIEMKNLTEKLNLVEPQLVQKIIKI